MPHIITPAALLPVGYSIIRWHTPTQAAYLLVYCVETGRYVAGGKHYASIRRAVTAAKRSAWMLKFNQICKAG